MDKQEVLKGVWSEKDEEERELDSGPREPEQVNPHSDKR